MISLHTLLFLSVCFRLAISAPAASLSLPTLALPTDLTGDSNGNCANSLRFPQWSASDWNIYDCYQAVNKLYIKEVWNRQDKQFEFVAKAASATRPDLGPQRTPRKYTVGMLRSQYFSSLELTNNRVVCSHGHDVVMVCS